MKIEPSKVSPPLYGIVLCVVNMQLLHGAELMQREIGLRDAAIGHKLKLNSVAPTPLSNSSDTPEHCIYVCV